MFEASVPWEACLTLVTTEEDADLEDVTPVVSSPCDSCGTELGGYTNSQQQANSNNYSSEFYRSYHLAFT